MSMHVRAPQILWDGTASSGVGGRSKAGFIGAAQNITIFIKNTTATPTTVTAQLAPSTANNSGRNANPDPTVAANWYNMYDGTTGDEVQWSLGANGQIAINVPNVAAQFIALTSSADVTLVASVETSI